MYQLGNKTDRDEAKNKIRKLLTARRRLYEAGVALLECDNAFAGKIKHTLETMTFTSKVVNIVGAGGRALPIDAPIIQFYLATNYRIYVRKENIKIDFQAQKCSINLNDEITACIPIKDGIAIKGLTLSNNR